MSACGLLRTFDVLGVPVPTLYRWRCTGTGPTAYRLGKHLRYDPAEVRAWVKECAEQTSAWSRTDRG